MMPAQIWPPELAAKYRQAGYWRGETFGRLLRERVAAHHDRTAVVGGGARWSYAELDVRADRIAAGFRELGFRPGDRVLLQLGNVPEFLSVTFGLFRAGLIPVFCLPAHRKAEIERFATIADASGYVVMDEVDGFDYRKLADEVKALHPRLRHVIVRGDPGPFTPLTQLEAAAPGAEHEPSPDAVAFLQLSGGSTGPSKLIPRTHDDYIYSFRASAAICGLDPDSVYLGALPIGHNFPMSSPGIFGTLYSGATVALSPSPNPAVAFPIIAKERVTITAIVPPLVPIWIEAAGSLGIDLSSLEVLQVGGAKLADEIARRVSGALGARLQQVFGMAEGLVCYTRLDDPEERIVATQGRPISPDDELRIVDDHGGAVAIGSPGHLLVRGPYTIRAYHNDPDANARAFTDDGFYRTGDMASLRPDGYLVVHGRADDRINRGGEKVSAEEIEGHLLAHPDVRDAAVVSVPDRYLGERSCAFVMVRGQPPKAADIRAWVRSRGVAGYKVPDAVMFVDDFPATGVGKLSRRELRAVLRRRLLDRLEQEDGAR